VNYFLYAETAFHHEGDYEYLKSLVDIAVNVGCHGVKFQVLINLDDFMSSRHSNYKKAKKWVLSGKQWKTIAKYAYSKQMKIIAMPCDVAAVKVLESLLFPVDFYDIHSVSFYDSELLEAVKATNKPVILGVGGRTLEEIISAKEYFKDRLVILMVGFQAYPSDLKDVKIQKIAILKQLFPDCLIGYADHTAYDSEYAIKSLEYAYILGARVFEKHIASVEGVSRIDYEAAVGAEKLKEIEEKLEYLEKLFPESLYENLLFSNSEIKYRNRQKVLVASEPIKAGEKFTVNNISLKMADIQEGYTNLDDIMGKVLKHDMLFDEPVTREKILSED